MSKREILNTLDCINECGVMGVLLTEGLGAEIDELERRGLVETRESKTGPRQAYCVITDKGDAWINKPA